MSEKFLHKYAFPQTNFLASEHKATIPIKLPKHSSYAKRFIDPYTKKELKIVLAGTIFPIGDANAVGIVMNNYDVTEGDAEAALLVHGAVFENKLPKKPIAEAREGLKLIHLLPNSEEKTADFYCEETDFYPGEIDILNVLIFVSNTYWLPIALQMDEWQLSGNPAVKKEEIGLISPNLLIAKFDVSNVTYSSTDPSLNMIMVTPSKEVTEAKDPNTKGLIIGNILGKQKEEKPTDDKDA